jgi:hypothetical protein
MLFTMKVIKISSRVANRPYAYIVAPRDKNALELIQKFKLDYGLPEKPAPEESYYGRLAQAQLTHLKKMRGGSRSNRAVASDLCEIFVEWLLQKDGFRLASPEEMEEGPMEECWFA